MKKAFIDRAVEIAGENILAGGGPFGALVVKDGKIIAESGNLVTQENDPTAHAEVLAIRKAAAALKNFDLSDCTIYASCEPCPMCLGAIYWARIPVVYYAADRKDAEEAGFDDKHIYEELSLQPEERKLKMIQMESEAVKNVFQVWRELPDKTDY